MFSLNPLLIIITYLQIVISQELVSPCPRIFQYETKPNENDRWYGTATLSNDAELTGIWFKLYLDRPSIQLGHNAKVYAWNGMLGSLDPLLGIRGYNRPAKRPQCSTLLGLARNWFGEVRVVEPNNTGYLIHNRDYKYKPNTNLVIKFYVKYNPNEPPPRLLNFRINARTICPEPGTAPTTEPPRKEGQLFTNPASSTNGGTSTMMTTAKPLSINPGNPNVQNTGAVFQRPNFDSFSGGDSSEEFFQGDYGLLFNPHQQNNVINAACGTVIKQPKPLITHGQSTFEGEFPWHAALYHTRGIDLTYICGGSLISTQHVITVGHCVTKRKASTPLNPENLVVYLGKFFLQVWKLNPGIQDRQVSKVIVHPKYNPDSFSSDIAILKLLTPVEITNYVRPVCLWSGDTRLESVVDKLGTVVGWGFDETGKVTEKLTKAFMPIVSQETCIYSFPDFYSRFTSSSTFCAGFQNGTSVCNGDSGGGLVLPKLSTADGKSNIWHIRGLISISVALQNRFRCDASHYVVFTDVAKYMDFINKALVM